MNRTLPLIAAGTLFVSASTFAATTHAVPAAPLAAYDAAGKEVGDIISAGDPTLHTSDKVAVKIGSA